MSEATPAPRPPQAFKWTQKREMQFIRYIDALDKRAKWEPGIKRDPLRAEAIKVLEQVRAAIREAEA
jgi:hypothetical protein